MSTPRQDFLDNVEAELRGDGDRRHRVARKAGAVVLTAAATGSLFAIGATAAQASTGAPTAPASSACNSPSGGPYPEPKAEGQTIVCETQQYVWKFVDVPSPLCYHFTGTLFGGPCGAPEISLPDHTSCI